MKQDIKSVLREELSATISEWGFPTYRTDQVIQWLYRHRATDWPGMSNLPGNLKQRLSEEYSLNVLECVRKQGAEDTTQKFLWKLADGALIESVWIPANPALYGEPSDRRTLCISTQVGCAYGCRFCASGLAGFRRNLSSDEIVEQILAVERYLQSGSTDTSDESRAVNNIVVMGMGEPLANYDALIRALNILNADWGGNIGARRITISTSGLVPQIERLAAEPQQYRLAISLHGATDAVRDQIMPINRKYPLAQLMKACEHYRSRNRRKITFEYILIEGINDGLDQVAPLAGLARRLDAKVNLIPYNPVEGLNWHRPDERTQDQFLQKLEDLGITATLRREKGTDIDAACGQLRLKTLQDTDAQS